MNNTWFIGDTHFGHKNILKYEPYYRNFKNIDEHNEALIDNWNKVVRPNDTIFHLGDFCFGRRNIHIAGRLNGKKRLVMGNHDVYDPREYLLYFQSLHGMIFYKEFVLSHMPCRVDASRAFVNIHGHLHSNNVMTISFKGCKAIDSDVRHPNYFNVSCEQINLTPIHLDEVRAKIEVYFEQYKKA